MDRDLAVHPGFEESLLRVPDGEKPMMNGKGLPHWAFCANAQWGSACGSHANVRVLVVTSPQARISYNTRVYTLDRGTSQVEKRSF